MNKQIGGNPDFKKLQQTLDNYITNDKINANEYDIVYHYMWTYYYYFEHDIFVKYFAKYIDYLNPEDIDFKKISNGYGIPNPGAIVGFDRTKVLTIDSRILLPKDVLDYDSIPSEYKLSEKLFNNELAVIKSADSFIKQIDFLGQSPDSVKILIIGTTDIKKYKPAVYDDIICLNIVDTDIDYGGGICRIDIQSDMSNPDLPTWFGNYKFDYIYTENVPLYLHLNPFFIGNVKTLLKPSGSLITSGGLCEYGDYTSFFKKHNMCEADMTKNDTVTINELYIMHKGNKFKKFTRLMPV